MNRIPNTQDIAEHAAQGSKSKWAKLPVDWRCPCCRLSRNELLRWISSDGGGEWGGTGIHLHHDHGPDERSAERFLRTEICAQCNFADTQAKRLHKLPSRFSFSPDELAQFVTGTPHGTHVIDFSRALNVYNSIAPHIPDSILQSVKPVPTCTSKERKAQQRQRDRELGFVEILVKVHHTRVPDVRSAAIKLQTPKPQSQKETP